jgi:Xaa-Pro aminopeptidase
MREEGVDALFLTQPTNVWYTAGFWEFIPIRMEAVLVPPEGPCTFIVSKNEFEYADKVSWMNDVRYYTEFPEAGRHQNPYDLMLEIFREKRLEQAAIGIEDGLHRLRTKRHSAVVYRLSGLPSGMSRTSSCQVERWS